MNKYRKIYAVVIGEYDNLHIATLTLSKEEAERYAVELHHPFLGQYEVLEYDDILSEGDRYFIVTKCPNDKYAIREEEINNVDDGEITEWLGLHRLEVGVKAKNEEEALEQAKVLFEQYEERRR